MCDSVADIARRLRALADEVERADWAAAWQSGDAVTPDQIASICGCSADTMRRRGEAAAAEGYALGVHPAGVWLFLVRRVLDWIELHYGRHARLEAESRARKNADLRLKTAKGARNRRGCVAAS